MKRSIILLFGVGLLMTIGCTDSSATDDSVYEIAIETRINLNEVQKANFNSGAISSVKGKGGGEGVE